MTEHNETVEAGRHVFRVRTGIDQKVTIVGFRGTVSPFEQNLINEVLDKGEELEIYSGTASPSYAHMDHRNAVSALQANPTFYSGMLHKNYAHLLPGKKSE